MTDTWLDPPDEPKSYLCPVCFDDITGSTRLYKTISGEIVGCELCIASVEAGEEYEYL